MILPDVGLTDSFDSIDMLVAHRRNAKENKEAKTPTSSHLSPHGGFRRKSSFMAGTMKLQSTGKEFWKSEGDYDKLGWEGRPIEEFIEKGESELLFTGRGSFSPPPHDSLQPGKIIITQNTLYIISDTRDLLLASLPISSLERLSSFSDHDLVIASSPDTELLLLLDPAYASFFEEYISNVFTSIREIHESASKYATKTELHPQICKTIGIKTSYNVTGRDESGGSPSADKKDRDRAFEENVKFNRLQYLYKNEGAIAISDMYNRETKSHAKRSGLLTNVFFNSSDWKLKITELLEQVVTIEKQQNVNPAQLLEIYEAIITILERATEEIKTPSLLESSCRLLHHSRREVSKIQGILAKGKLLNQHHADYDEPDSLDL